LEELTKAFELERVNKSGARFDPEKIKWFNHHYMQEQSSEKLAALYKSSRSELSDIDNGYIALVVDLIKERATFVSDFWELSSFFFVAPSEYDEKASKKAIKDDTRGLMQELVSVIESADDSSKEAIQDAVKGWITSNEIGFGKVMMPLRLALVGALQGPDVFDIMFMIGKAESIKRINQFIKVAC